MTTSILETAYKEDGCTDEIKASAFKQFARNYLRTEGRGSLETIFNEIIRLEEPVSLRNYLLGIYRKLRDEFEKQFDAKSFAGKRWKILRREREKKRRQQSGLNWIRKLKQDLAMRKLIRSGILAEEAPILDL